MPNQIEIKNGTLIIELPIEPPRRSKSSGKTYIIASTHGFRRTGVVFEGHEIYLSLNAGFYPPLKVRKKKAWK